MGKWDWWHSRRGVRLHTASLVTCTAGLFAGCGDDEQGPSGELVIGLQTNLSLPDDIDRIELDVESTGQSLLSERLEFDSSPDIFLPAYFSVRARPSAPIHVTVRASRGGVSRTLREIRTTIPANRVALLRVPIDWLCYDADDTGKAPFVCSEANTCVAGECVDWTLDPDSLPDYVPQDAGGDCFDTLACFSSGMAARVDTDSCTIDGATNRTSVALVMKPGSRGICGPRHCLLPIDAHSAYGWQQESGRIQMPDAVCDRLENDDDVVAIATTTDCEQKTESLPTCGPWSGAGRRATFDAGPPDGIFGDGGPGPGDSSMATGGAGGMPSIDAGAGGATSMDAGAGGATGRDAGADAAMDASVPMDASPPDASADVTMDAMLEASSCTPSSTDLTPPTLLSAAMISADEVLLTFSERVTVPTGVDPTQFRLSFAEATNAEGAYTYYSSLSRLVDGEPENYAVSALDGECTDQIIARLAAPLPAVGICQEIEQRTGTFTVAIGLFLHFRQDSAATVEDPSGNALQSVAESWATPALVDGAPVGLLPDFLRVSGELPDGPVPVSFFCGGDGGAPDSGNFPR